MHELGVMLPVYNMKEYIGDTIDSILSQSFENFELVILDDASTDGTSDIIKKYTDKRIKYFYNDKNEGIIESRNKLIDMCSHKYQFLAKIDADDICIDTRFEKQLEFLKRNLEYDVVSSNIEIIPTKKIVRYSMYNGYIKEELMFSNIINNSSALFRSNIVNKNNVRYDILYRGASDYKFWLDLSKQSDFYILDEALVKYRVHDNQESSKNRIRQRENGLRLVFETLSHIGLDIDLVLLEKMRISKFYTHAERKMALIHYEEILIKGVTLYTKDKLHKMIKNRILKVYMDADRKESLKLFKYIKFKDLFENQKFISQVLNQIIFNKHRKKRAMYCALDIIKQLIENNYKKVSIYGAGEIAKAILANLNESKIKIDIEAIYVSDINDKADNFMGIKVLPIEEFTKSENKAIAIASIEFKDEMSENLNRVIGKDIHKYKIITIGNR